MSQCETICWAKRSAEGACHPLADHCTDVAAVFRALLDLPGFWRLAPLDAAQKDRLAAIAFLHDFGKCNWGFQAKASPDAGPKAGHVLEALALLFEMQGAWPEPWRDLLETACSWFTGGEEHLVQLLVAAVSHHGRPVSENDYRAEGARNLTHYWKPKDRYDPLRCLGDLASHLRSLLPAAFGDGVPAIDANPSLQHRFAGLVMLADWIGSDVRFFPFRASPREDRGALARAAAPAALKTIGLAPPSKRDPKDLKEVFEFSSLSSIQAALAGELPLDAGSRLVLVESDTGSGKTEAALAWFFRLYAAGHVHGLYFALPTRVAARELYARVLKAIRRAFDEESLPSPILLAAPGYVRVDGVPVLPDAAEVLWEDDLQARRREPIWAAERPKRFLAAPIAVGTVDQALLAGLRVKHSLLRSVCLDRHLLVVDEVHASDIYMRQLLQALLGGHLRRGGWAVLLSATLGESAAAPFFQREVLPLREAVKRPYPALSTRHGERPAPNSRPPRSVEIHLSSTLLDDSALLPHLAAALQQGARILAICNTVARANALFRAAEAYLQRHTPELLPAMFALNSIRCPHHGRFARADRELLDARVTAALGKNSPPGPLLLIGTQTLEQSLDIDADWLITDLAPMDVLLQRLGRLHRHQRPARPPEFSRPCAWVRIPDKPLCTFLQKSGELRGPAGIGTVYADGRVLALTLLELQQRDRVTLPDDNRELIENATHPDAWAKLPEEWRTHGYWLEGKFLADAREAASAVLREEPFWELHYADRSERVLTRLGAAAYDIPLETPSPSPFGALVDRLQIPAHWLGNGTAPDRLRAEPTDEGFRIPIGDRLFRYSRFGLENAPCTTY